MTRPGIWLSAFADEAANSKTAIEQLSVLAALGMSYYSPRFVDVVGSGKVKHVTELDVAELTKLKKLHGDYGMKVTSIGARLGKVKLLDIDDGTHNRFVPDALYHETDVAATIRAANALDAKLIRGFSFYHPKGEDPAAYVQRAADRIGPIVDLCATAGLVYGLEVEANLVGQNGRMLAALATAVGDKIWSAFLTEEISRRRICLRSIVWRSIERCAITWVGCILRTIESIRT